MKQHTQSAAHRRLNAFAPGCIERHKLSLGQRLIRRIRWVLTLRKWEKKFPGSAPFWRRRSF